MVPTSLKVREKSRWSWCLILFKIYLWTLVSKTNLPISSNFLLFFQCEMFLCQKILENLLCLSFDPYLSNSNAAQATHIASSLRLLIHTLPSLPHAVSSTICRALKKTWLDKWPGLNTNLSHSLIYKAIFQPYQLLIQMTMWALVWGGCEVGEDTHQVPVNAVSTVNGLNKLWKCTKPSALLSPWMSNTDLFASTLQKS